MKDEALKLALEALETELAVDMTNGAEVNEAAELMCEAITAIKQALAAPVQEPVATLWQHGETGRTRITMPGDITDCDARWFKASDLYTTPPAAPVQDNSNYRLDPPGLDALYTTPPAVQRQWVGLTDEDVYAIGFDLAIGGVQTMKAYKAIEAKLKGKNAP
mgnify:CR=1 FL=1